MADIDVLSHIDTMKFTDKTSPFDTTSNCIEVQIKFRRYVHTAELRSPATEDIRGYGRAGFDLLTFEGDEKRERRQNLATILFIST